MRTMTEVQKDIEVARQKIAEIIAKVRAIPGHNTEAFQIPEPYKSQLDVLGEEWEALKDEEILVSGEKWDGRVHLACAGIGEGDERPMRKDYPAMPGEIDEEAPRRF